MPQYTVTLGPLSIQTFTLALLLAVSLSIAAAVRRMNSPASYTVDVCLIALISGVVVARGLHVLLHWAYFAYNPTEIMQPGQGGLNWHGGLIGGLMGVALAAHWRKLSWWRLVDALALALPLLTLGGWWGCLAANCGYGAEVPTLAGMPPLLVAEMPDVYGIPAPRYNTQLLGLVLGASVLALVWWLEYTHRLTGRRFWLGLLLLSGGMLGIGFLRADYMPALMGLRADQWLDTISALLAAVMLIRHTSANENP